MWDSILGLQDHTPGCRQRQTAAPPGLPKDFVYLFMRHTHTEAETQAEGEAGSKQGSNLGLDPGSPGSGPGLKAALNHRATRADLVIGIFEALQSSKKEYQ